LQDDVSKVQPNDTLCSSSPHNRICPILLQKDCCLAVRTVIPCF
jgi:hypothetical protein